MAKALLSGFSCCTHAADVIGGAVHDGGVYYDSVPAHGGEPVECEGDEESHDRRALWLLLRAL